MTDDPTTGSANEPGDTSEPGLLLDAPITREEDDRFGRSRLAAAIATDLTGDVTPIVVAVVGRWGSGKSSVIELVRAQLDPEEVVTITFNPWLFSGPDQLIQRFFGELVSQLATSKDERIRDVANRIERYSEILTPLGTLPGIGGIAKAGREGGSVISRWLRRGSQFHGASVEEQRQEIAQALAASKKRFVVFIDDIDRLEEGEVRDIVRLVRLVADFPRVNYLLAFDRQKVELALGRSDQAVGREYLEKIVQVTHRLPLPEPSVLSHITLEALTKAMTGLEQGDFDTPYWSRVWRGAVQPLIRTPRDVVRYANAVRSTLRMLGQEVNPVDLLVLEAYRVLLPDVFDRLENMSEALTSVGSGILGTSHGHSGREAEFRQQISDTIAAGAAHSAAVKRFLEEVFPASGQFTSNWSYGPQNAREWRAERRVANAEILAIYMTHTLPPGGLPAAAVHQVFKALTNRAALETYFAGLQEDEILPLLDRLEDYEGDYPDDPTDALVVLLNLRSRLPASPAGAAFFGLGDPKLQLERVVLRLLRKVEPESRREEVLRDVLPQITNLSGRWLLLFMAGHREGIGAKLISDTAQAALEEDLRGAIRDAGIAELAGEPELLRLLHFLAESSDPANSEKIEKVVDNDAALAALLQSARADSLGTDGSGVLKRRARLAWQPMEGLLPGGAFARRVAELSDHAGGRAEETVALAKKYASGWRPKDFGDDEDE